jgi:23S rRNA (uracil1939-C5)-methyltransferase
MSGEAPLDDMLWIMPRWARALLLSIRTILIDTYKHFPLDGFELKLSHGLKQAHLILSVKRGEPRDFTPLAEELMARIQEVRGVAVPSLRLAFGDDFIRHRIRDREFVAHYGAFFQSHPGLTPSMLDEVEKLIGERIGGGWVDLYCGVGLLSLSLASPESWIMGVDSHTKAVESAARNAKSLGFTRAHFMCARMEFHSFQEMEIGPEEVILIDPPRSGCPAAIIRAVADLTPRAVCLVSCFPRTHFRDLESWQALGYAVEHMSALDMFPFTRFLETVTMLTRKS